MQGLRPPIFRRYPARQRRSGLRGGPIWVQQYRRAATHRRRTAASSTTEFQISGSIGLCGGSYCLRPSSPRLGQGCGLQIWHGEVVATQGALLLQKCLIMNPLQKCKDHSSLQFYRRRSNRFGKNRLTDACRAVFSKQAAPRSHAFFSCHEPLSPDTRCGEHRRGLSSRPPGAESLKHRRQPRRSRPTLSR